jgi:disulfide oxidoreductase YuzD
MIKHDINKCATNNGICNFINRIFSFKIIPTATTVEWLVELVALTHPSKNYYKNFININKIVEMVLENGLVLNRDILKKLLSLPTITINDDYLQLDDISGEYDEDMYFVLYKVGTLNKYHTLFTTSSIFKLRSMCFTLNNVHTITSFMIENSVKLDRYCWEISLVHNELVSKYMLEKKCIPTIRSIELYRSSNGRGGLVSNMTENEFFKIICNEYQTIEYMTKSYDFDL